MVFLVCLGVVLSFLVWERWRHERNLNLVPLRIHVHGTRGKSSVTREIARCLRFNGMRVMAKTTGDRPELILPDGSVRPWKRWGPARIQEHIALMRSSRQSNVEAVVVECLAIAPETIYTAGRMLRASHTVITNCRPDHQETMGETVTDIARTLALVLPDKGSKSFITVREPGMETLAREAEKRGSPFSVVELDPSASPEDVNHRIASEIADNLQLTMPPREAVQNMVRWQPISSSRCLFLDLFSANDVVSAQNLVERHRDERNDLPLLALLATRPDRPLRTRAFTQWLSEDDSFSWVVPAGWHAWYAWHHLPAGRRFMPNLLPNPAPSTFLRHLETLAPKGCRIIGLGNSHGYGEKFRHWIESSSKRGKNAD